MSEHCIFCKIIEQQIPSVCLGETEHAYAFMDIQPGCEGHALVVPKVHAANIFEISEPSLMETVKFARQIALAMKKGLGVDGLNVFQSNGAIAFQSVFHLHFHLLPRAVGDNISLPWQPQNSTKEQLESIAKKVRAYV